MIHMVFCCLTFVYNAYRAVDMSAAVDAATRPAPVPVPPTAPAPIPPTAPVPPTVAVRKYKYSRAFDLSMSEKNEEISCQESLLAAVRDNDFGYFV